MEEPSRTLAYELWMLSRRAQTWPTWKLGLPPALLLAAAACVWGSRAGRPAVGVALALILIAFSAADWALFRALPRRGLSFGPVRPPWLALAVLRCGIALGMFSLPERWPLLALLYLSLIQAGVSALVAYGTLVEPFRLQVRSVRIPSRKLSNPGTPLRIVHLSDLHIERLTRRERAVLARTAELKPDLILLTGDYLSTSYNDDPRAVDDLREFLLQLRAPLGVYAIWGTSNVDLPPVLRPLFAELPLVLLEDQAVEVSGGEHRLWLMGLRCRRDRAEGGATLRRLLAGAPPGAYTILLHHTPDLMPQARDAGVDLVLSGHTHGGQWCLPFFGALHTSSHYWKRYESGHRRERDTHLYVSRGLGMEGYGAPRARFFCPPEVVALDLLPSD
jgi:predicted MPP superfamily phosphohydrolase